MGVQERLPPSLVELDGAHTGLLQVLLQVLVVLLAVPSLGPLRVRYAEVAQVLKESLGRCPLTRLLRKCLVLAQVLALAQLALHLQALALHRHLLVQARQPARLRVGLPVELFGTPLLLDFQLQTQQRERG